MRNRIGSWCWAGLRLGGAISLLGLLSAPAAAAPLSWNTLLLKWLDEEPDDRGVGGHSGGRPVDGFCLIAPTSTTPIWHQRPVFVWQGQIAGIGVRPQRGSVVWRAPAPTHRTTLTRMPYANAALTPGQTYDWLFFSNASPMATPLFWKPFQVMTEAQRAPITRDLQILEAKLKATGADADAIALQRADYFANRRLWADMLQELYAVKQPSAELQQVAESVAKTICNSAKK